MTRLLPALAQAVAAVVDGDGRAFEHDGAWTTWPDLHEAFARLDRLIDAFAGTAHPTVGVMVRNRPVQVAMLLALLRRGGCVVVINPSRGADSLRRDVVDLRLPLLLGEPRDVAAVADACEATATASMAALDADPVVVHASDAAAGPADSAGVAVRMLTSGTTGPPKRIDLTYDVLEGAILGARRHFERSDPTERTRERSVAIVNSPLAHLGGVFRILQCVVDRRPFVLLERFQVEPWLDAVRRYRPKLVSLVPTALRMVLHANPPPEDLASIKAVVSGTAPLAPEDAEAFQQRYGARVLTTYAATEFGGGVAGWTLQDHQVHWEAKRGSVGRALPGCRLRVVDEATGEELPPDQVGLLEVWPGQLGTSAEWIRTTDLARIDADGFLYILGRADRAIIRGGFKVLPDQVQRVLERHPDVLGAAVLERPDERLGAVPVALVEWADGGTDDRSEDLRAHAAAALAPYEVPVAFIAVPSLPRTTSGKVDLGAAARLLDELEG